MLTASGTYKNAAASGIRYYNANVNIDWDGDDIFSDEVEYTSEFELERSVDEPKSAIHAAQANVLLIDNSNKFTPIGNLPTLVFDGIGQFHLDGSIQARRIVITSEGFYFGMIDVGDATYYKVSKDSGLTWSEAIQIDSLGSFGSIDIDSSDNIYVIYAGQGEEINFRKLTYDSDAKTWSIGSEVEVNATEGVDDPPIIKVESGGRIWVVYNHQTGDNAIKAKYSDDDGDNWSVAINVSDSDADIRSSETAILKNNILYVCWVNGTENKVYESHWDGSSAFTSRVEIAAVDPDRKLSITKDSRDILYMIYELNDILYLHKYEAGAWSSATVIARGDIEEYNISSDGTDIYVAFDEDASDSTWWLRYSNRTGTWKPSQWFLLDTVESYGICLPETVSPAQAAIAIPCLYEREDITYELYVINLISSPKFNLRVDIPAKLSVAFEDYHQLQMFQGKSELPQNDFLRQKHSMHFYDEIKSLDDSPLPHHTILTSKRTDEYIGLVLREYWTSDNFKVLHNCDTYNGNGTWVNIAGCSNIATDTSDYMEGAGSVQFDIGGVTDAYIRNSTMAAVDLSRYYKIGKIRMWLYLPNITNLERIQLYIGSLGTELLASMYVYNDFKGDNLSIGWNLIEFDLSDGEETEDPVDYTAIDYIQLVFEGTDTLSMTDVRIDDITIYKPNIPAYYHDKGLQTITIAFMNRNKSLYEIKTSCEAEGGRFYIHELGHYVFENRQHYIVNDEHKSTSAGFAFNNMLDIIYPTTLSNTINKVVFTINKRVEQSSTDIWIWPEVPKSMAAGTSITVWGWWNDPCETITNITATTDYTANAQADGGGADKTGNVAIVQTKFANANKLVITNNDAGTVYITLLKLRGQPYEQQGAEEIVVEDEQSQRRYGVHKLEIENKYLDNQDDANAVGQSIIDTYAEPLNMIKLKRRSLPYLQIGDQISVYNNDIDKYHIQRITAISENIADGAFNMDIVSKKISSSESGTYFTIGVSEIGGNDSLAL